MKLYCEYELSDKPPILLIHGFASSSYTFRRIIPLLQKQFSIIAVDLPGFGRSEKSTSFIYSTNNYAKLMFTCMDKFNVKHTHIIAHSMGGQIALHMARISPERIKKLVLLNSSGYLRRAKRLAVYSSYLPLFDKVIYSYIHRKTVHDYLQNTFFNKQLINEELMNEFSRPLTEKNFYKSLIRLLRHREGDLSSNQLKEINAPTLLIWGEEDRVVPIRIGQRLANDLPDAKFIAYEKTGHFITEEKPNQIFNNILTHMS
jgi:pimeloyl-ACP methyl ester carboxylesterase